MSCGNNKLLKIVLNCNIAVLLEPNISNNETTVNIMNKRGGTARMNTQYLALIRINTA